MYKTEQVVPEEWRSQFIAESDGLMDFSVGKADSGQLYPRGRRTLVGEILVQIADGFLEVLDTLLIVAHHALYGAHHMSTRIDAVLMVVIQGIMLHILGDELSLVALLMVGKVKCLIGPRLIEGALVASLLGRYLQFVGNINESRLVVFIVELVHLFLQLSDVVGSC